MVTDPASSPDPTAATSLPSSRNPKTARRLHEPFVSPEFGASAGQGPPRLSGGVGGALRAATGDARDQAAPLYTVNVARANSDDGALVAHPSPLTDSLLLGKRMSVADAGCLSVGGPASGTALVPVGLKGVQFHPKSDKVPPPHASKFSGEIKARSTMVPPRRSSQDISSLVTGSLCTWGQELGTILGQAVLESSPPAPGKDVCYSPRRPGLTTSGLFPQIMILRYVCRLGMYYLRIYLNTYRTTYFLLTLTLSMYTTGFVHII